MNITNASTQSEDGHNVSILKKESFRFGRKDFADVYQKAKDYIYNNKLFRVTRYIVMGELNQLTICNLWRIEKWADGTIHTLEYSLNKDAWEEVDDLWLWPEIPFFPVKSTHSLNWWRYLCEKVIHKALVASGYDELPALESPSRSKKSMAACLRKRFLGRYKKTGWCDGQLNPKSMEAGARCLRAVFWDHFVEKEVLSALLVIRYTKWEIKDYIHYAKYSISLMKVSKEHRNLLPVLVLISPEQWGRDDLFSRKLWVKDGRKSTVLDRKSIRSLNYFMLHSFDYPEAWTWLKKASSVIIREWVHNDNTIISNLALANINIKAPVYAYVKLIRQSQCIYRFGVSVQIQQLLKVFLKHCAVMWKENGFKEVQHWLRHNRESNISDIVDYLDAEGFERGFPNKQSTWTSLRRLSEDWHRRIATESMKPYQELKWNSLVPHTVINGIEFTPLTDAHSLSLEGYEMSHCIGMYANRCVNGSYIAFSVREPNGTRSTLGLMLSPQKVTIDQHRGGHNSLSSQNSINAGKILARMYQEERKRLQTATQPHE